MTATPPDWRVKVKANDILKVSATYDTRAGLLVRVDGDHGRSSTTRATTSAAPTPFDGAGQHDAARSPTAACPRTTTTAAREVILPDARRLLSARGARSSGALVEIRDFLYARGDLSLDGNAQRPPVVRPGQSLTLQEHRRRRRHLPHDHGVQGAL